MQNARSVDENAQGVYDRVMLTKAASAAPVINQISPENPVFAVDNYNYSYKVFSCKKGPKRDQKF